MPSCITQKSAARFFEKLALVSFVIALLVMHSGQAASAAVSASFRTSIPTKNSAPARIAIDPATGMIFVASPSQGSIIAYSQDGTELYEIGGFKRPLSVAVDGAGRLYVGDSKDGSVTVMDRNGRYLYDLGKGDEEFGLPGDIAVTKSGRVYVTDSVNNRVKIYDAGSGAFISSFGTFGSSAGQFNFPTGITFDETNQELYVVDQGNGRVEVFDPAGSYKKYMGAFGSGSGRLTRPQGLSVAGGYVYVTDSYQSAVEVFGTSGNFVTFIGSYGRGPGSLVNPIDSAISGSTLFVSNYDNTRIEAYTIADPQGLSLTPSSLSFTADEGVNPAAQSVEVDALASGSAVPWTATASAPFPVTLSQTAGTTPSSVTVSVDVTGLAVGTYYGSVTFQSSDGTDYPVAIVLTVKQTKPQLLVSPDTAINLAYQDGQLTSQTLSVSTSGKSVAWSAATDAQWLTVSPSSGSTPGSLTVSLNDNVNALSDGMYNASVTINAPDALGSPITIPVVLTVVRQTLAASPAAVNLTYEDGILTSQAISVTSNSNVQWTASSDAAWLTLSSSGGATPGSVTVSVNSNVNTLSDGMYTAAVIISATTPNVVGSPVTVPVTLTVVRQRLVVSQSSISLFHQIDGPQGSLSLAVESSGGVLDWTATPSVDWLTVSPSLGSTASTLAVSVNGNADSLAEGQYSATIAINAPNAINSPQVVSVALQVVKAGTVTVSTNLDQATFTISGPETYTGTGTSWENDDVKPGTYTILYGYVQGYREPASTTFEIKTGQSVTLNGQYRALPVANVVAVAKGSGPTNDATVRVLDLNGGTISQFRALSTNYGANVAMGDLQGDGGDEVLVTPGSGPLNEALLDVFGYDGTLLGAIPPVPGTVYGASVAAGDIDGDGRDEIAISTLGVDKMTHTIIIYSANGNYNLTELTRFSFSSIAAVNAPANIAFGDLQGDGRMELIVSYMTGDSLTNTLSVYSFDASLNATPVASVAAPLGTTVSAMDLNGDGLDEIVLGYADGPASKIKYLNGDLTDCGTMPMTVFAKGKSAPTLSVMDTDGDGLPDLLAGMGAHGSDPAVFVIYDSRGTTQYTAFDRSTYGVNGAFGVIKR